MLVDSSGDNHIVSPYYVTLDEVFCYSWQMRAGDKFVYQFFSVIPGNILLLLFLYGKWVYVNWNITLLIVRIYLLYIL